MFRTAWRALVVGAIAAAGLALPGTANAAVVSACTIGLTGTHVTVGEVAVVNGTGAIECLLDPLNLQVGTLPDALSTDPQYIQVSLSYSGDGGATWTACAGPVSTQIVEGVGASTIAEICPDLGGYMYKVHLHAHIAYTANVDVATSTFLGGITAGGCVHDSPTAFSMTCFADAFV